MYLDGYKQCPYIATYILHYFCCIHMEYAVVSKHILACLNSGTIMSFACSSAKIAVVYMTHTKKNMHKAP